MCIPGPHGLGLIQPRIAGQTAGPTWSGCLVGLKGLESEKARVAATP